MGHLKLWRVRVIELYVAVFACQTDLGNNLMSPYRLPSLAKKAENVPRFRLKNRIFHQEEMTVIFFGFVL